MTTTTPSLIARQIREAARDAGLTVSADGTVLTVSATFEPGDRAAYLAAEAASLRVLRLAPTTSPGTTWGTDSGSVGGHHGMTSGFCRLSKSGVSRRVVTAVRTVA